VSTQISNLSDYKRVLIALPGGGNPMYYEYHIEILKLLTNSGVKIFFVQTVALNLENLIPWILDRCFQRYSRFKFRTTSLTKWLSRRALKSQQWAHYFKKEYRVMDDLKVNALEHPSLGDSLYSEFATTLALSSNPSFPVFDLQNTIHRLIQKYLYSHQATSLAVEAFHPDAIVVMNGRFLSQAATKDVANTNHIPVFYLEHGGQPGLKYHLEVFQTQDREAFQRDFLNSTSKPAIPAKIVDDLLDQYRTNSLVNPFMKSRHSEMPKQDVPRPLASVFTSSIDEEVACPNWNLDNVETLTKRTIELSNELKTQGYRVIVVIHPNAMNKSWADLSLQMKAFTKGEIEFVRPWSDFSSYKILSDSDLVVTWRSTIGLEATAYGKNLLVISDSNYDLVLTEKVSYLTKFGHYFPATLENQKIAREYVFHLQNRGHNLIQGRSRSDAHLLSLLYFLSPLGGLRRAIQRRVRPIYNFVLNKYSPSDYLRLLEILGLESSQILEKKLLELEN
jgi:hypothetical protein